MRSRGTILAAVALVGSALAVRGLEQAHAAASRSVRVREPITRLASDTGGVSKSATLNVESTRLVKLVNLRSGQSTPVAKARLTLRAVKGSDDAVITLSGAGHALYTHLMKRWRLIGGTWLLSANAIEPRATRDLVIVSQPTSFGVPGANRSYLGVIRVWMTTTGRVAHRVGVNSKPFMVNGARLSLLAFYTNGRPMRCLARVTGRHFHDVRYVLAENVRRPVGSSDGRQMFLIEATDFRK
jgi:hypothetical protein